MTFKIIASGDHHFDERSRFDECIKIHRWMAELVKDELPDVFLSGGDIFERASTPLEREAVAEWLTSIAKHCPVVIAKGNHDRHKDLALFASLKTNFPIIVEERAGVHRVGAAKIGVVAWPDRASIEAMIGKPLGGEALDSVAREQMSHVLRGIGDELRDHNGPTILLGHFMFDGSVTSVGQPLIGSELNLGTQELDLAISDMVIMGHIHKPQEWQSGESPVAYTGSPYRTAFGETEDKSVIVAEFDGYRFNWRREKTPARQMILIDARWEGEDGFCFRQYVPDDVRGAEIRFRYQVPADQREAAKAGVADFVQRLQGADVKVEAQTIPEQRARVPEISTATSVADKLARLWQHKGFEPGQRRDKLISKVEQLEDSENAA